MNATLTVTDPLAEREVSIVITLMLNDNRRLAAEGLTSGKQPRDERPALVSIGVAGQMPIIKSGVFGSTMELIEEAWLAFGVQAQLAEQTAAMSTDTISATTAEEVIAETPVLSEAEVAVVGDDAADLPSQCSAANPAAPKPAASNLSLF
ncbi:MAG: hypothetical protein GY803_21570 [Chloroflexi bacterium]|nr:hypothetical protein [Chloroflexota bacterium]